MDMTFLSIVLAASMLLMLALGVWVSLTLDEQPAGKASPCKHSQLWHFCCSIRLIGRNRSYDWPDDPA